MTADRVMDGASGSAPIRIVAFAFSCKPGEGSDGGAGWTWARLLAGIGDTTLLVARSAETPTLTSAIAALSEAEAARLHVVPVDPPGALRWLSGNRWAPFWYLEYAVWQVQAVRMARRLERAAPFDVSWHLTWANAWFGSLAASVGQTFVLGPVGAGAGTPWRLVGTLGARGAVGEVLRTFARTAGRYLNPWSRRAISRAALILVQNPETERWLPADRRKAALLLPHVVLADGVAEPPPAVRRTRTILFAGRLLPWKGGSLVLRTLARLPDHRLIICGGGPDEARLRAMADRLGVAGRVEFRGWVERRELTQTMRDEASVFLFPSLHDEGGWVVVEARSNGLPVVCLDRGGPVVLGGIGVEAGWPKETVRRLAEAVRRAESTPPQPAEIPTLSLTRERVRQILEQRTIIPVIDRPSDR